MTPAEDLEWVTDDGATLQAYVFGNEAAAPDRRVLVVCGAFLPALVYAPFAAALINELGDEWGVYVYDRRGKGKSTPVDKSYGLDTETGDVALCLRESQAQHLIGHSLGGSIVLHTVHELSHSDDPQTRALLPHTTTVYDPAINIDGSIDTSWLPQFHEEFEAGHLGRALALVERHMGMSRTLSYAPNWMVSGVLALSMKTGLRGLTSAVFPAGAAELTAAFEEEARASDFAGLDTRLCVMTGERSADYFQATTVALARSVPDAELVVSPKGLHGSIPAVRHSIVESIARWLTDRPLGELNLGIGALPAQVRGA